MIKTTLKPSLFIGAVAALLAGCTDDTPLAPDQEQPELAAQFSYGGGAEYNRATTRAAATLRRVTARYHDLNVAIAEGFVFLHGCENRPDEGPVGTVYVHLGRLMDGKIDPESPDALIYEPRENKPPKLVGVEFAVPYPLWTEAEPPKFLGNTFQAEDEFGVFGLHAWVWRKNPEGLFAESNPRVSCGEE